MILQNRQSGSSIGLVLLVRRGRSAWTRLASGEELREARAGLGQRGALVARLAQELVDPVDVSDGLVGARIGAAAVAAEVDQVALTGVGGQELAHAPGR